MKLKSTLFRRLCAALFLVVGAVVLAGLLPEEKTLGWFVLAFFSGLFALGTIPVLANLLPGSSGLELTSEGMTIRSLYQNAFFAWPDLQEFSWGDRGEGRRVRWSYVAGHREQYRSRNLPTRFAAFKATLPDTYGYPADKLAALLNEWRLKSVVPPVAPVPESAPLPPNRTVEGKIMTVTLDPQIAQARHHRGVELTIAGKLEEALAELEAAQILNPLSYDIQMDKAVALRFLERFPEALEICDAAMAVLVIPPATLLLFYQLRGDVLREQGRWEAALESFQRSLEMNPEPRYAVHPHHQKALLLAKLGRQQEAVAACDAAVQLYPGDEGLRALGSELRASDAQAG